MGTTDERNQEGTGENEVPKGTGPKLFSSEYQPTTEARREGQLEGRKKRLAELKGRKMLEAILAMPYKGPRNSALKDMMIEQFGLEEGEEITNEMMMHLRQVESAIKQGNTGAYNAIRNRVDGMPGQSIKHGIEDDNTTMDFFQLLMKTSKK